MWWQTLVLKMSDQGSPGCEGFSPVRGKQGIQVDSPQAQEVGEEGAGQKHHCSHETAGQAQRTLAFTRAPALAWHAPAQDVVAVACSQDDRPGFSWA